MHTRVLARDPPLLLLLVCGIWCVMCDKRTGWGAPVCISRNGQVGKNYVITIVIMVMVVLIVIGRVRARPSHNNDVMATTKRREQDSYFMSIHHIIESAT